MFCKDPKERLSLILKSIPANITLQDRISEIRIVKIFRISLEVSRNMAFDSTHHLSFLIIAYHLSSRQFGRLVLEPNGSFGINPAPPTKILQRRRPAAFLPQK